MKMIIGVAIVATALAGSAAEAAYTTLFATGADYTQNFNTLGTFGTLMRAMPDGFRFTESGSGSDGFYAAGNGDSSAPNSYSFGTSASDRAFGFINSFTFTPALFGEFVNGSDRTITALTIGYTGEQWRYGATGRGGSVDRIDFAYSLNDGAYADLNALDFVSPQAAGVNARALDGNQAANRRTLSFTLSGLSIAAGERFAFRWQDAPVIGTNDSLAVDDFGLTATFAEAAPPAAPAVPEPATWASMALGFGLLGGMLRARRRTVAPA